MAYILKLTAVFVCTVLTGCSFQQSPIQYPSYKYNLSKPDLGPIIGKTTPVGFRVWVKSEEGGEIGFFRYRLAGSNASYSVPVKFRTASQWYTGIGLFDVEPVGAEPGEVFEYQVGFLKYPEVISSCKSVLSCLKWQGAGGGRVRLFPKEGSSQGTRFLLGSCRDNVGAKGEDTFRNIAKLLGSEESAQERVKTDFIIQAGDQVYIDGNMIRKYIVPTDKTFQVRYKRSFGKKEFSKVVASLPNYMILDDHEIINDWSLGKFQAGDESVGLLALGQKFYETFQASLNVGDNYTEAMNPKTYGSIRNKKYWYNFQHGVTRFFVLDTRSGNTITKSNIEANKDNLSTNEPVVIGTNQERELKEWLCKGSEGGIVKTGGNSCASMKRTDNERVHFIVSPVPLFPDTLDPNAIIKGSPYDKWGGAVLQRRQILDFIRNSKIKRVVFLSGDVHTSFISELTYVGDSNFRVYNIVSSPLNWSTLAGVGLQEKNYDFAFEKRTLNRPPLSEWTSSDNGKVKKNQYTNVHGDPQPCLEKGHYCVRRYITSQINNKLIHKVNNFARISVIGDSVQVEFFKGSDGKLLESTTLEF